MKNAKTMKNGKRKEKMQNAKAECKIKNAFFFKSEKYFAKKKFPPKKFQK